MRFSFVKNIKLKLFCTHSFVVNIWILEAYICKANRRKLMKSRRKPQKSCKSTKLLGTFNIFNEKSMRFSFVKNIKIKLSFCTHSFAVSILESYAQSKRIKGNSRKRRLSEYRKNPENRQNFRLHSIYLNDFEIWRDSRWFSNTNTRDISTIIAHTRDMRRPFIHTIQVLSRNRSFITWQYCERFLRAIMRRKIHARCHRADSG